MIGLVVVVVVSGKVKLSSNCARKSRNWHKRPTSSANCSFWDSILAARLLVNLSDCCQGGEVVEEISWKKSSSSSWLADRLADTLDFIKVYPLITQHFDLVPPNPSSGFFVVLSSMCVWACVLYLTGNFFVQEIKQVSQKLISYLR